MDLDLRILLIAVAIVLCFYVIRIRTRLAKVERNTERMFRLFAHNLGGRVVENGDHLTVEGLKRPPEPSVRR